MESLTLCLCKKCHGFFAFERPVEDLLDDFPKFEAEMANLAEAAHSKQYPNCIIDSFYDFIPIYDSLIEYPFYIDKKSLPDVIIIGGCPLCKEVFVITIDTLLAHGNVDNLVKVLNRHAEESHKIISPNCSGGCRDFCILWENSGKLEEEHPPINQLKAHLN